MRTPSVLLIPAGQLGDAPNTLHEDTLRRLEAGLARWKRDRRSLVLVTGGIFRPRRVQTVPAADLMADWLGMHGVPAEQVLLERRSVDTYQNVKGSLKVLANNGIDRRKARLTVITQFQHLSRFWAILRLGYGIRARYVPLWYVSTVRGLLTELPFLAYTLVDWRGEGFLARWYRARLARPRMR